MIVVECSVEHDVKTKNAIQIVKKYFIVNCSFKNVKWLQLFLAEIIVKFIRNSIILNLFKEFNGGNND